MKLDKLENKFKFILGHTEMSYFANSQSELISALSRCENDDMIAFEIVNFAGKMLPDWKTEI